MDWREQGFPCSPTCRWCDGPRTKIGVGKGAAVTCVHACLRCDVSERDHHEGPPKFVTVWDLRRLGEGKRERE